MLICRSAHGTLLSAHCTAVLAALRELCSPPGSTFASANLHSVLCKEWRSCIACVLGPAKYGVGYTRPYDVIRTQPVPAAWD